MVESFSISTQKRSGRTLRYMVQYSLTYGTGRYLRGLAVDSYHLYQKFNSPKTTHAEMQWFEIYPGNYLDSL